MVQARWSGMGLVKADLLRGRSSLDGGAPGFFLLGILYFSSDEAMQAALAAHGAEVMGDIPNFTDVTPTVQINESIGG